MSQSFLAIGSKIKRLRGDEVLRVSQLGGKGTANYRNETTLSDGRRGYWNALTHPGAAVGQTISCVPGNRLCSLCELDVQIGNSGIDVFRASYDH